MKDPEPTQPAPPPLPPSPEELLAATGTEWGSSRYSELARCPRAHHLRYGLRVERRPEALSTEDEEEAADSPFRTLAAEKARPWAVGVLGHACLAGEALGRPWREVLAYAEQTERLRKSEIIEAARCLRSYDVKWGRELPAGLPGQILVIEEAYEDPDLQHSCRVDAVVDIAGVIHVVDHKFRGRKAGELHSRYMRARPQYVGCSYHVARAMGLDYYPPVLENRIITTREVGFQRTVARIEPADVQFWQAAQLALAQRVHHGEINPFACAPEIGRPCDYFEHCHGSAEQRERLFQIRK